MSSPVEPLPKRLLMMPSPVVPPPKRLLMMPNFAHPVSSVLYREPEEQAQTSGNINAPNHFDRRKDTQTFPPGYRFCPFDDELIVYYLQKKVNNEPISYNRIQDVNIYMHNPEHLADQYQELGDGIWYFFSPRERRYPNGKRPKRAAGEGYWKATGGDKPVKHEGVIVGKKKSLVFYLSKPPNSNKTDWLMQEYTIDAPPRIKKDERDMRLDDWVLCKIYKKAFGKPKKGGQEAHNEQMTDAVTSPEEEVVQGANYDDYLVEENYDYNMSSGYTQPPSQFSALTQLPQFSNFPNDINFSAHPPQQQVVDYGVQSVGVIPSHVQETFGSFSTMDDLLALELPHLCSILGVDYAPSVDF